MSKLKLLLAVIAVGAGVALTYHVFENAVHAAIDLVWYDWFNTDNNRWLVIPLAVVLSLTFFGVQHRLDPKSEHTVEDGLGNTPEPNLTHYVKILGIGFLSLLAGASLGPEAVLVPACIVLGAVVGKRFFKDKQAVQLLMAAGTMALFTAFFHSVLVGILSLALVTKQTHAKPNLVLVVTAIMASLASYFTLQLVSGEAYVKLPPYDWHINVVTVVASVMLAIAGYGVIYGMKFLNTISKNIRGIVSKKSWWLRALMAAVVLSGLYLLGGPLVEFTGNRSITPMFEQAAGLGLAGLFGVLLVKMAAISWSKTIGYRGGVIFPTIFLAMVLVAMVQLYVNDFNLIYGLIAVLIGAFVANGKTRVLV